MANGGHSRRAAPPTITVELIGGRGVYVDHALVVNFTSKPGNVTKLLCLLAIAHGHALPRSRLCRAIWPSVDRAIAIKRFSVLTTTVRRTLETAVERTTPAASGDARWLDRVHALSGVDDPHDPWIGLCQGADVKVDLEQFLAAHDRIRGGLAPRVLVSRCASALEWYLGKRSRRRAGALRTPDGPILLLALEPLIPDAGEWAQSLRWRYEVVRRQYLDSFSEWLDQWVHGAGHSTLEHAFVQFERLMHAEPLDPATERAVIALAERARRLLAEDPVHARFLSDRVVTSPKPPVPTVAFIGRQSDRLDLVGLVWKYSLVTIVGPAGVGKTTFADYFAATWAVGKVDAIYRVTFENIDSPGTLAVPQAIADAMEVYDEGGHNPLASIAKALAGRYVLLVLDNCELMQESVAVVCNRLLDQCPHLTILRDQSHASRLG